jgi:hypothetical protein
MMMPICEILKDSGYKDSFGEAPICYNGKYHHTYFLSYLTELQKHLQKVGKPFFHYTSTSVAHEVTGRRIQTLDEDLANYFYRISTQNNTLTVLFSDHGVHYGALYRKTDEAHVEMYNPALTILASKDMPQIIGEDKMKALAVNQDRLVNVIDLHYAFQTLAPGGSVEVAAEHAQYDIHPMGLLAPVNVNRTCDSVPRIQPNICICEGFDISVANDTRQMMVAEFALGEVNNLIQSQFRATHPDAATGFGSCKRLVAKWFSNVVENNQTVRLNLYSTSNQ